MILIFFFFFFQAEDGIRDIGVTGVQTCALPISFASAHATPRCRANRKLSKNGVETPRLPPHLVMPGNVHQRTAVRTGLRTVGELETVRVPVSERPQGRREVLLSFI